MRWSRGWLIAVAVVFQAGLAEARFGKAGSGGSTTSSSSSSSSSSSTSTSSSSGNTHAAVPVGSSGGQGSSSGARPFDAAHAGYFSGAFVPTFGYAYRPTFWAPAPMITSSPQPGSGESEVSVRATANAEFQYFLGNQQRGFTLGINGTFEGERWGGNVFAQNIAVQADDGTNGVDNLQQLSAHVSFAFLTGEYGRLRVELGGDTVFAPDVIVVGPTIGLSGVLWIAGPLALETSVYGTLYPFWQLDWRAAVVFGSGPIGLKLGMRVQVLDDRGVVDGVVHRDVFPGPWAGVGFAF